MKPSRAAQLLCLLTVSAPIGAAMQAQPVAPVPLVRAPDFFAGKASAPPPSRLARSLAEPLATLPAASEGARDQLAALRAWNDAGREPTKNGFSRPLPVPLTVRLARASSPRAGAKQAVSVAESPQPDGSLVWGTKVKVSGAYRLRLHLEDVELPPGTRAWVYSGDESVGPFGLELLGPAQDLWTPSVAGETASLEVEVPASGIEKGRSIGFRLTEVAEIFALDDAGGAPMPQTVTSCFVDGRCVGAGTLGVIDSYRKAVAAFQFMDGSSSFACSGGLLNDRAGDLTAYFLTANHCISNQAAAHTFDAFWDYYGSSCNGSVPNMSSLPRSHGAALLATSVQSDFTLLLLDAIPSGRVFMGWDPRPSSVTGGTVLYRLSHPVANGAWYPQVFSKSTATYAPAVICQPGSDGRPVNDLSHFIYSTPQVGNTFHGSSGAPMILDGGNVVGQLLGSCPGVAEPCQESFSQVDGSFAITYPAIRQWIDPVPGSGLCIPGSTTLCIDDRAGDRRFEVRVHYSSPARGLAGDASAIPLASLGIGNGGAFSFFSTSNPEMLIKILNACSAPLGNRHWVFFAAVTDVGFTVTVRDTVSGTVKTYSNADGQAALPVQDTSALACP